jgi:hypothetical protein
MAVRRHTLLLVLLLCDLLLSVNLLVVMMMKMMRCSWQGGSKCSLRRLHLAVPAGAQRLAVAAAAGWA